MVILQITDEKKEKLGDLVEGIKAMALRLDECWDGLEWGMNEADPSGSRDRYAQPMSRDNRHEMDERYREYPQQISAEEMPERRVYRSGQGYVDGNYRQRY